MDKEVISRKPNIIIKILKLIIKLFTKPIRPIKNKKK
jgi:hypothetical protein